MAETKANFRLRVARRVGLVTEFLTTAVGAADKTTFIAASLGEYIPNGVQGLWVRAVATGDVRRVVAEEPGAALYVVDRPFSAQIASGASLELYHKFSPIEIDEATRAACGESYPYLAQLIVDTSLTTLVHTYEYNVPSTIEDMERSMGAMVEMQINPVTTTWPWKELFRWSVRQSATALAGDTAASTSYKILIDPSEHLTGRILRITGMGMINFPTADTNVFPLPNSALNLLALLTISIMYERATGVSGAELLHAQQLAQAYRAQYEAHKDQWSFNLPPSEQRDNETASSRKLPIAFFAQPS